MSATLDILRREGNIRSFPAGSIVFNEGDPAEDFMFFVIEGVLDVHAQGKFIHTIEAGGVVGEMALIDHKPRSATVIVKVDTQVAPIDRKRFTFLVQQTPNFALQMMEVLVTKLREMTVLGVEYL